MKNEDVFLAVLQAGKSNTSPTWLSLGEGPSPALGMTSSCCVLPAGEGVRASLCSLSCKGINLIHGAGAGGDLSVA